MNRRANFSMMKAIRFMILMVFGCHLVISGNGETLISYDATVGEQSADPETAGWTTRKGNEFLGERNYEDAVEDRAWKIGSGKSNVNRLLYCYQPGSRTVLVSNDWKATARLKVIAASGAKVGDAVLRVQDGKNEWTVGFVKLPDREELVYVNAEGAYTTLGAVDFQAGFFDLEMKSVSESDGVQVSINGEPVGNVIARSDVPLVPNPTRVGIEWGDDCIVALPTDARTEVDWQKVNLEILDQ